MKIAVDIDDVLVPFFQSLADWYNDREGTSHKLDTLYEYKLSTGWGGEEKYWIDQCNMFHSSGGSANIDIEAEAHSALLNLAQDHEIALITSRPSMHRDHTTDWLERNLGGITDQLIMCDSYASNGGTFHMHKGEIAKDMGAAFVVDDALHHVERINEAGVRAILFGDYPWNKGGHDRFEHAKNWGEVVRIIQDANV